MKQKEQQFRALLKEISLLNEVANLLGWDALTGMPKGASQERAEVEGYIAGKSHELSTGKQMEDFLTYFKAHPEELTADGKLILDKVQEGYDLDSKIPKDQFEAYVKLLSLSNTAWEQAREEKDYSIFKPSLEKIIETLKTFIPLWRKNEATAYDVLLNQYEPGMTVEILDKVFTELREGITALRQEIASKGTPSSVEILSIKVPKAQQHRFVTEIAKKLDFDFNRGRLDDTVHPFMTDINHNDARITTRWYENDFKTAVFGVIHETGHAIYEQNVDSKYAYTPLINGTSMGIHESQSLFYELILGGDKLFWQNNYALFQEITEGAFDHVSLDDFYRALNQTQSSLIRVDADSLTYPLHIIIRYEIEKMIFNEEIDLNELPRIWNDKYQEYLGITPENDLEGILQDVHWSGGSFGYFPSYALGYMYAAQLRTAMLKDIDLEEALAQDNYRQIREWLTAHIHQYGASKKPNDLIVAATGESLNPQYLLELQKERYFEIYNIQH